MADRLDKRRHLRAAVPRPRDLDDRRTDGTETCPLRLTSTGGDAEAADKTSEWRRVRVWVDGAVIAEEAKPDPAWCQRYAESMLSRYPFATVTNEPLSGAVALP